MSERIRVLHIVDKLSVAGSSIHGIGRLFSWWFPKFDYGRFDVSLVSMRRSDKATEVLRERGVDVTALGRHKFDPFALKDVVQLIKSKRVDVLHLHSYAASNFGLAAAILTGTSTILHEHFVDPSMEIYQVPFDFFLARRADVGIAVSASVKRFMVTKRYMPEEKIDVIFNGAPLQEFKKAERADIEEEKKRWKIPDEVFVVGSIGRIDQQKGNGYFLAAAADVLKVRQDVVFMVVGDGPLEAQLRQQCRDLGIADRVIFTGFQSNTARIQSMFDIQVFPSLWEGTPLTLFEAMATERPIVATNVDGLGEVLEHGTTALLVEPRNSKALAESIIKLLEDRSYSDQLAHAAFKESTKYDVSVGVEAFQSIYQKLYDERTSRS